MRARPLRIGERVYFSGVSMLLFTLGTIAATISGLVVWTRLHTALDRYANSLPAFHGQDPLEFALFALMWTGSGVLIVAACAMFCWIARPRSRTW